MEFIVRNPGRQIVTVFETAREDSFLNIMHMTITLINLIQTLQNVDINKLKR